MLTQEIVLDKIKELKNSFISSGFDFDKIILFGSFSSNTQREDSDIDVAIISDLFSGFAFTDRQMISKFFLDENYSDIDAITIPLSAYNQGNPFVDEIKSTGIEI